MRPRSNAGSTRPNPASLPFSLPRMLCAMALLSSGAWGQVCINEFSPADEGIQDREFVELFEKGIAPRDISGWSIQVFPPLGPWQTVATFGRGWTRRTSEARDLALSMLT